MHPTVPTTSDVALGAPRPAAPAPAPAPARTIDGERLLALFAELVPVLSRALPPHTWLSLHDLATCPPSPVVGADWPEAAQLPLVPGWDLPDDAPGDRLAWEQPGPDGTAPVRTTAYVVRDVTRTPVVAVCVHTDLGPWLALREVAAGVLGEADRTAAPAVSALADPGAVAAPPRARETPRHLMDLATRLIDDAVGAVGVAVDDMKKEHKLQVVSRLQDDGLFLLKDAVEMAATAVGVTRFTIYNYLNELGPTDERARPGSHEET